MRYGEQHGEQQEGGVVIIEGDIVSKKAAIAISGKITSSGNGISITNGI